ncbi:MAG: VanW family protein [Myxococcales bacterium]|nr:VanW family protein [Myxococcales bacterium]
MSTQSSALPVPSEKTQRRKARKLRNLSLLISLALVAAFFAVSALLYSRSLRSHSTIPGLVVAGADVGSLDRDELERAVKRLGVALRTRTLTLEVGKHSLSVPLSRLGARVDVEATIKRALSLGKGGDLLPDLLTRLRAQRGGIKLPLVARLDRDAARAYVERIKATVDRAPVEPRIDLDAKRIVAGRPGYRLRLYDTLAAIELAVRAGKKRVALAVSVAKTKNFDRYEGLDISHVLAEFSTVYALTTKYKDRTHNLKVGAAKLDGYVLRPGELLSYNKVVGPRNKAQGYRTAPVITAGELVDGMAGGSCQLSSTLFAAAFFAGLSLESSRPHTIPSGYIKMGLDATVSYPLTDLVIKNPYPFPVVIHFTVAQGRVRVRLLGKKRPYRKIVFRRTLKKQTPFKEVVRDDPSMPRGVRVVVQAGVPGFMLERERLFFVDGKSKPVKTEKRELRYPPTSRIVKRGTGKRQKDFEPPKSKKDFGGVKDVYTLSM